MKSGPRVDLVNQVVNGRFIVHRRLGGGSFGEVFEAEDSQSQQIVALKLELGSITNPQLPNEYKCLKLIEGSPNAPRTYALFDYQKNKIMALEKLGPSLEVLFKRCGKKFSLKTVLMLADQMFRSIEYVHNSGILHRDIKPHNFLMGRGPTQKRLFLIDFGVSTQYIDPRTHEHMMYTSNNGLVGTVHYVSINTHLGDQQSRRDDLESIGYVLIRFLKGSLPWQAVKTKSIDTRNEKITQMKIQTSPEVLCQGIPKEFRTYMEAVRKLRYDETPKYHWFRSIFNQLFLKKGFLYDGVFDWDEEAAIHRPLPCLYLTRSAARYVRVNERKIRNRKEKVSLPEEREIFLFGWKQN